jgi:hypothetical protein
MAKWQPGLPVKVKPTADLEKLGDLVMKGTLALWEEEMDRYVCSHFLLFSAYRDEHTSYTQLTQMPTGNCCESET